MWKHHVEAIQIWEIGIGCKSFQSQYHPKLSTKLRKQIGIINFTNASCVTHARVSSADPKSQPWALQSNIQNLIGAFVTKCSSCEIYVTICLSTCILFFVHLLEFHGMIFFPRNTSSSLSLKTWSAKSRTVPAEGHQPRFNCNVSQ